MPVDDQRVRQYLKASEFDTLFREELGWNRYRTPLTVIVEGQTFTLAPIAERNGMAALRRATARYRSTACAAKSSRRSPSRYRNISSSSWMREALSRSGSG